MKQYLAIFIGFLTFSSVTHVCAGIVFFDYSSAPETVSITANDGELRTDNLFLSQDGVSRSSGEIQISLSAFADKRNRTHWATIELGDAFTPVSEFDRIGLNTDFQEESAELISVTGRNQKEIFNDYIALRFTNVDGEYMYGWAEVVANVSVNANGKQSLADFSINRFAFNDESGESIIAGQTESPVIPEPAVASLIIGSGFGLLATRRIFIKA